MIMLYRDGDKYLIDGIKCEHQVFEFDDVESAKADGWKTHQEFFFGEEKKQRGRPRKDTEDANEKKPD